MKTEQFINTLDQVHEDLCIEMQRSKGFKATKINEVSHLISSAIIKLGQIQESETLKQATGAEKAA